MDILVLILALMSQLTGLSLFVGDSNTLANGNANQVADVEFVKDGGMRLGDKVLER